MAAACSHEVKSKTFRRFYRANVFYMIAMTLENTDKCSNVIAALAKCKSVNKNTNDAMLASYFFVSIARANINFR